MKIIARVLAVCTVIILQDVIRGEETTEITSDNVTNMTENINEWNGDDISDVVESIVPTSEDVDGVFEGRTMCRKRKKHKQSRFLMPLLLGFLLIKSLLLPIALKGLAVLSGKAVILSLMSLILAAIVGLKRVAQGAGGIMGGGGGGGGGGPSGFSYDGYSRYRRNDQLLDDRPALDVDDPYRYYRDQRRKK